MRACALLLLGGVGLIVGSACSGDDGPAPCSDAAAGCDAGVRPREDAGPDAGADGDAGAVDGGVPDAAIRPDAGPPPPLDPRVTRFELVASDPEAGEAPAGAPGNSWGGHQQRIVRLSTGEVYAAYIVSPPSGTDPSDAQWVLVRRGADDADGWSEVGRRRCGREPMHLLRTASDGLLILSWPGRPAAWTVTTGPTPAISDPDPIPGGWETLTGSSTPYSGAGVSPDGHVCFIASRGVAGTMPGATYSADSAWDFACRAPSGAWSAMTTLPIGLRFCYPFVLTRDPGAWRLVATRDVLWEAAGYTRPAGAFSYVFNAVDLWQFDSPTASTPAGRSELGRLEPGAGSSVVRYAVGDAMVDHLGRLHVLTQSRTSAGDWQMRHLLVDGAGEVTESGFRVGGYTDGSIRLVQDDFGRFVLLFTNSPDAYALLATDGEASAYGSPISFTDSFAAHGGGLRGPPYIAAPRGGTPAGRFVDLLMDSADGALYYVRIALY